MDQCTHEVRAEYWRNIIKTCGQRPAGQSAKKWIVLFLPLLFQICARTLFSEGARFNVYPEAIA